MNSKLIAAALVVLMMIAASMAAAPEYCSLEPKEGFCFGSIDRYYFNVATGSCELFKYSGCQGNENNFDSQTDCEAACVV